MNTIKEIQNAENKAQAIIAKAHSNAEKTTAQAKTANEAELVAFKNDLTAMQYVKIDEQKGVLVAHYKKILAKGEEEVTHITETAKKNEAKSVQFILNNL